MEVAGGGLPVHDLPLQHDGGDQGEAGDGDERHGEEEDCKFGARGAGGIGGTDIAPTRNAVGATDCLTVWLSVLEVEILVALLRFRSFLLDPGVTANT